MVINLSVIHLLVQEIYLFYYLTSRAWNLLTFAHDKLSDTQQQSFLHRPCVTICTCPSAYITVAAVLSQPSMGRPRLWARYYFVVSLCVTVSHRVLSVTFETFFCYFVHRFLSPRVLFIDELRLRDVLSVYHDRIVSIKIHPLV